VAAARLDSDQPQVQRNRCANCFAEEASVPFQCCGRCKQERLAEQALYCGVACQKQHWKAGHKRWHEIQSDCYVRFTSKFSGDFGGLKITQPGDDLDLYAGAVNLGMQAFMVDRNLKQAAKYMRKAISIDGTRADAYMRLGMILQYQEAFPKASRAFHSALQRCDPHSKQWAMTLLQLISVATTARLKWLRPRCDECSAQLPAWYHNPYAQIEMAKEVCRIVPDDYRGWHWQASMLNFLAGRWCAEAAQCWQRAAQCVSTSHLETKANLLRWAQEAEDGTGEPPMPGMWDGPDGGLTPYPDDDNALPVE